jgi:hypothetical protein
LFPSEPILVNKSLPAPVAGGVLRPKLRAQHRPGPERAMMSPGRSFLRWRSKQPKPKAKFVKYWGKL